MIFLCQCKHACSCGLRGGDVCGFVVASDSTASCTSLASTFHIQKLSTVSTETNSSEACNSQAISKAGSLRVTHHAAARVAQPRPADRAALRASSPLCTPHLAGRVVAWTPETLSCALRSWIQVAPACTHVSVRAKALQHTMLWLYKTAVYRQVLYCFLQVDLPCRLGKA